MTLQYIFSVLLGIAIFKAVTGINLLKEMFDLFNDNQNEKKK